MPTGHSSGRHKKKTFLSASTSSSTTMALRALLAWVTNDGTLQPAKTHPKVLSHEDLARPARIPRIRLRHSCCCRSLRFPTKRSATSGNKYLVHGERAPRGGPTVESDKTAAVIPGGGSRSRDQRQSALIRAALGRQGTFEVVKSGYHRRAVCTSGATTPTPSCLGEARRYPFGGSLRER